MENLNPCREAAKKYLRMGYSVIPVFGKVPAENWKDYQARAVNEDTVDMWWDKYPTANVGIITGRISNLTVIDVDGDAGVESIKKLNIKLPPTKIVKTPHGWHYYYKYNSTYPNCAGIVPNVDIRNDGGFVVAPPSTIYEQVYE